MNMEANLGYVVSVTGFIGAIVHGALHNSDVKIVGNHLLGVWYSCLFLYLGLSLVYLAKKPPSLLIIRKAYIFELTFWVLVSMASFISFVGYAAAGPKGGQAAAIAWSLLSWLVAMFGCRLAVKSRMNTLNVGVSPAAEKALGSQETEALSVRILRRFNGFLRVMTILFQILLCAGACVAASAYSYHTAGNVVSVTLTDGTPAQIGVYCSGPKNVSQAVIFLVMDSAHGVVDMQGLQYFLNQSGRRVCSYNNIGFDTSSDYISGSYNIGGSYFHSLLQNCGEQGPFILAGNGGGGEIIVQYAGLHPEMVKSLILLYVYPPGIEFQVAAIQKNLDAQQLIDYRKADLSQRIALTDIILGLGLPWGLMPVFVPFASVAETYYPPDKKAEFRVQLWKNAMWSGQKAALKELINTPDSENPLKTTTVSAPVTHVLCNLQDSQVQALCDKKNTPAEFCQTNVIANNITYGLQVSMTKTIHSNSTFIDVTNDDCNILYPVEKAEFTATQILSIVFNQ